MHIRKEKYVELLKVKRNYKKMLSNYLLSFLFGGLICVIGQFFLFIYEDLLHFETVNARSLMTGTMVLIAAGLSAFGVYDKLGQIAHAGSVIPITGFANSMVSSAMEYKPEGFLLGIGANTFKLAGAVICLGVVFAYIIGLIRYIVGVIF